MDSNEKIDTSDPIVLKDYPFSLIFTWEGKERVITLKKGEDVLRLAEIYKRLLNRNDIEYSETFTDEED